jgi:hypothetical protein
VVVRGDDGRDATLALDEIVEANLVVDWGSVGRRKEV